MMILYVFPVSPFCDKIRRVLHVKRIPYRTKQVSLVSTLGRYKRINPTGKVPCLEDEGRRIGDSTNIAHYLDEKFPTPPLLPLRAAERALCQLLEDWADESLYYYQKRLKFMVPENAKVWTPRFSEFDSQAGKLAISVCLTPRQRQQLYHQGLGRKSLKTIIEDVERLAASIARLVDKQEWLVGDALSLADIAVSAQLSSLCETPQGLVAVGKHPAVLAWMARVDALTLKSAEKPVEGSRVRAVQTPKHDAHKAAGDVTKVARTSLI